MAKPAATVPRMGAARSTARVSEANKVAMSIATAKTAVINSIKSRNRACPS